MALNVSLLREELRYITINPEKHNQGLWAEAETDVELPEGIGLYSNEAYKTEAPRPSACGSFGCLAGNTVIHSGTELDWYQSQTRLRDGRKVVTWQADNVLGETVTVKDWYDGHEYEEPKSISRKAQELFDLTPRQADRLFDGDNTLDTIWAWAEKISGGEITADKGRWGSDYATALREFEAKTKLEKVTV